jgi:EAL domain-containing protein (putative c-di-GMP-specific phosphodiesterase class I)
MASNITERPVHDALGELRQDRDRFVALAFSSADMLFELDREQRVVFAAGATGALLGAESKDLAGRDFADIATSHDRPMIHEAFAVAATGARINGLVCRLEGQFGKTPPLMLLGHQVPDLDGHYYLGLRLGAKDMGAFASKDSPTLGASGLPTGASFATLAGAKLTELGDDSDCKLTLLNLGEIDALRSRLDVENSKELSVAIGGVLRASAIGGELAGEIDSKNYGIVHRPDADLAGLTQRIEILTRNVDPEKRGIGVVLATVALDALDGDPDQSSKALNYIFSQFADTDPNEFSINTLAQGLSEMAHDAESRITQFQQILRDGDFAIAFQPVVDLVTLKPHHFEALARFPHLPEGVSPYDTITFAEQTGMIREFDLAMCRRVLEWLAMEGSKGHRYSMGGRVGEAGRQAPHYKAAVNISGTSIASKPFVMELHKLLKQYVGLPDSLIFEITESAKIRDLEKVNATVQSLRRAGHKVCLDDFGAGAAAFQYLRDLEVDVVKIDGAYVKGALKTEKGMAFLRAMASLCNDLGITTIAEMVEDQESLNFIRSCKVGYGQGYLFGRPSFDISSFDAPGPSNFGHAKQRVVGGAR